MQSTKSVPYITAVLKGEQTELDLTGKKSFNFTITLTLHAKAPILCYTDIYDTFFSPRNALTDVGIKFSDHHTKKHIQSCHIDTLKSTEGPSRPLNQRSRLYLQPGKPVIFDIPFDVHSEKEPEYDDFDPWFCQVTSRFEDGGVYEAVLPTDRKISWWRWASFWEAEDSSVMTAGISSTVRSVVGWWTGDKERTQGVPVLPADEQLPVYIEGDSAVFSCVGKSMEWPAELLEKQRINEEKRLARERAAQGEKRAISA